MVAVRPVSPGDVVVGVDAGGTFTRVVCADLKGIPLSRVRGGGGGPNHNADARENVQSSIRQALELANRQSGDVVALVAGFAGLDRPEDAKWAERFTDLPGRGARRFHLNDAEVAHAGAFGTAPGIMVISGTGSNILAKDQSGRVVTNDAFHHYAGGARHLAFDLVQRILIGDTDSSDQDLLQAVLDHWSVRSVAELHAAVSADPGRDRNDVKRQYGTLAPTITSHVDSSPVARAACRRLVEATRVGVELLALELAPGPVPVVLEGGLASDPRFKKLFTARLAEAASRCHVTEALLPPAEGAALLALREVGVDPSDVIPALATSEAGPVAAC